MTNVKNISLCIDARMIKHSGIGVYLVNYINKLIDVKHISLTLLGNAKQIVEYISLDKKVKIIDFEVPIYSVSEQFYLPFVVPKCDVFWSPHYNVPLFPLKASTRIVTIHDVYHLAHLDGLSYSQKVYAKLVMKMAVKISSKIFTVSKYSLNEIVHYTNADTKKITVIYSGVSSEVKATNYRPFTIFKDKYKIPSIYILFVGNLKTNKNLINLLRAFGLIKNEFQDHELVIVGKKEGFINADNELSKEIERDATIIDRVTFTGFVDSEDLPYLYKNAALFAFPSLYEGFGFPPLEAMANQCPVVASNSTSIPEVCGSAAYYVDPYKVEDIANALRIVLTNPILRSALIAAGNEQYQKFKWSDAVEQFVEAVDELANL